MRRQEHSLRKKLWTSEISLPLRIWRSGGKERSLLIPFRDLSKKACRPLSERFLFLNYVHVCVLSLYVWGLCADACSDHKCTGAGVPGSSEPPNIGEGDWSWALCTVQCVLSSSESSLQTHMGWFLLQCKDRAWNVKYVRVQNKQITKTVPAFSWLILSIEKNAITEQTTCLYTGI